jgi:hypothetical protein
MSHPSIQDDHSSVQPEPEDDEFHTGPDQAARDRAIAEFLKRLEVQEEHGYTGLGDVLSRLPLPTTVDQPGLPVHDAMEAGMLQRMDDEESQCFTPTEVLLYQHAQDYSWTVEELRAMIVLLKRPEFKPADIDDDLHKRISKAVHDKMIH